MAGARTGRARLERRLCLRAIACCALLPLAAEAERYPIDPVHSQAGFSVRLIRVLPLRGEFGGISGWIDVDRATGTGRVCAQLAADALRMDHPDHAAWARSPEFFDAARYPEIRFESEPVPLALLERGGRLHGRLRVRGIERSVALSLQPGSCDALRLANCTLGVRGRIRRSDFGMQARIATVSDWVVLEIAIRTGQPSLEDDVPDAPGLVPR